MAAKVPKRKDPHPHAVALGKRGGSKGGKIGGPKRWAGVSPEDRSAAMRRVALVRWASRRPDGDVG